MVFFDLYGDRSFLDESDDAAETFDLLHISLMIFLVNFYLHFQLFVFCSSLLDCLQQVPVFPLELSISFLQHAVLLIFVPALVGMLLGGFAAAPPLGLFFLFSGKDSADMQIIPEVLL